MSDWCSICHEPHVQCPSRTLIKEVRCRVCGCMTSATAIRICAPCWEVEHRLEDFLEHPEGRKIVREALEKAEMKCKIVKRYTVNTSGNRFARVEFQDGVIIDVKVRDGWKGAEETRVPEIKRIANETRNA